MGLSYNTTIEPVFIPLFIAMSQASHISDLYSRVPLALRDDDEAEVLAEQLGKLAKVMMVDENARWAFHEFLSSKRSLLKPTSRTQT